ncbi:MAG TPA: hypothetical protein VHM65_08940, partial [Candidatus Lustribacter sp.]|nr:hypothetical protein [Candidatus Lustribacter sp.]
LRLDDIDEDEEPVAPPALLPGGPPWLDPPAPSGGVWHDVPSQAPVAPAPSSAATTPATASRPAVQALSLSLEAARAEVAQLQAELEATTASLVPTQIQAEQLARDVQSLSAARHELLAKIEAQRTQLRLRTVRAGKVRRTEADQAGSAIAPFTDPVRQLEHEIYLEWVTRIPAAEKESRPLVTCKLGPEFLASMAQVHGVSRRKVVQVVVEVLTGLAEQLDSRELHLLRTGPGGDDPPVVRGDGARCWRVAVQRGTPAAARLHFWRTASGVELSRVVVHDDLRP